MIPPPHPFSRFTILNASNRKNAAKQNKLTPNATVFNFFQFYEFISSGFIQKSLQNVLKLPVGNTSPSTSRIVGKLLSTKCITRLLLQGQN